MIGMLYKDLLLTRRDLAIYVLFLLGMGVVVGQGVVGVSILLGLMVLYSTSAASPLFAYDGKMNWPRYGACVSRGRERMVGGRYLYALLVLALNALTAGGILLVLSASGCPGAEPWEVLRALAACAAGTLVMDALILPVLFLSGPRARILSVCLMLLLFGGFLVLLWREERMGGVFERLPVTGLLLLAAALFVLSWRLTLRLYRKKEL